MKNIFLFLVARIAYMLWGLIKGRPPFGPYIFSVYGTCMRALLRREPYWQDLDKVIEDMEPKELPVRMEAIGRVSGTYQPEVHQPGDPCPECGGDCKGFGCNADPDVGESPADYGW